MATLSPHRLLRRAQTLLLAIGLASLLQACGMLGGSRSGAPAPSSPSPGTSAPGSSAPEISRPPPQSGPGRTEQGKSPPSRIADKGIDINGSCSQTEEDGYREQATLTVRNNQVQAMSWQLWVGKKGSCRFELSDFTQTQARPSIELSSRNGSACKLVVYQDPRRITLGFAECQKHCTGNIYDEAYPVMFDPRSGGCADLAR